MLLIKYLSILFIFLSFGVSTNSVDHPVQLNEATFVSNITDEAINAEMLEAFEDISNIDNIQLFKRLDAYVYQINGSDTNGKKVSTYAVIPMADVGQYNPINTLACGCQRNSKYWTNNGGTLVCEKYCLEIDPIITGN